MSFFNLVLKRKSRDKLIMTIPLYTRGIMLFFSGIMAYTFILEPGFSFLPLFILTVLLLTALYKESWVFDQSCEKVTYGFGLLFLYKKTVIPFQSINVLKMEGFVRGSLTAKPSIENENTKKRFKTTYWKLSLINSQLGELNISTVKGKQKEILQQAAGEISRLCKVPLTEE